jgi:hypothetical protein
MANTVLAKMAVQIAANTADFNQKMAGAQKSLLSVEKSTKLAANALQAFGIGFGAFQIAGVIRSAASSIAALESELSQVKAVTRATDAEFQKLRKSAIDLGGSTRFTATQVAELQTAFGRLGFNTAEILQASEATLLLATATREDLAKSADIAGSTLRAFGLDASEMGRVIDVMGLSFSRSALQLDTFSEAMKFVAPVARAANVTIEETTAILSALADNGIRGSLAGTSLRRILVDLTKDGRPATERIKELATAGLTLEGSFDEVGRIAQTALLVLANNIDKVEQGTDAYNNAAGAIKDMSDVIRDNLTEDVVRLSSAYDGLLQKLGNTSFARSFVQGTTDLINSLSGANEGINALENLLLKLNSTTGKVNDEFKKTDSNVAVLQRLKNEGSQLVITYTDLVNLTKEFANPNLYSDIIRNFSDVIKVVDAPQDRLNQRTKATREELARLQKAFQAAFNPKEVEELTTKIIILQEKLDRMTNVGPQLFQAGESWEDFLNEISGGIESVPTRIPLLSKLQEELDALQKKQKESFSAEEVRRFGIQIDILQTKISNLKKGVEAIPPLPEQLDIVGALKIDESELKNALDRISFIQSLPTGEQILFDGIDFESALATWQSFNESLVESSADSAEGIRISQELTRQQLQRTIDSALLLGDALGTGFADVITGQRSFAQGLASVTDQIVQQYGRQAIAAIIAKAAASGGPFPFVAVAAAAAGVAAISGILRSAAGYRGGGGGGGFSGGSRPSSSYSFAQDTGDIRLSSDVQIRGEDLYVVLTNYEKRSGSTRTQRRNG